MQELRMRHISIVFIVQWVTKPTFLQSWVRSYKTCFIVHRLLPAILDFATTQSHFRTLFVHRTNLVPEHNWRRSCSRLTLTVGQLWSASACNTLPVCPVLPDFSTCRLFEGELSDDNSTGRFELVAMAPSIGLQMESVVGRYLLSGNGNATSATVSITVRRVVRIFWNQGFRENMHTTFIQCDQNYINYL